LKFKEFIEKELYSMLINVFFKKIIKLTILLTCLCCVVSPGQELPGNNIRQFLHDQADENYFTDPVDDTVHYHRVKDNIFTDANGKVYLLNAFIVSFGDSLLAREYFRDYSDFIDLKTYRSIKHDFFVNRGRVYVWFSNSDGTYPVEIDNADFKTFKPFDNVCGGTDKNHVFYGSPLDSIKIIKGADPKTIQVLNPGHGCWNCDNCYFKDQKNVFFGCNRIAQADAKSFVLVNEDGVDCIDINHKYYDGHVID
jgi:hypothetical protein